MTCSYGSVGPSRRNRRVLLAGAAQWGPAGRAGWWPSFPAAVPTAPVSADMTPLCRHGVVGASRLLRMGNRASFHASRAVGPGLSRSRSRLRLFVSVRWSEARPGNSADVVDSATLSQSGWRSETTGGLLSRSVALHSRGREPDGAETRHRPAARFHRARSQHSPPAGKAGSRTPNVGSMKLARLRPSAGLCAGQSMQSAVGPGQCLCSWLLPVSLWRVEASLANSCTNLVPPRGRVGGRLPAVPGLRSVEAVSAASASGPVEGAGLSAWARDGERARARA